MWLSLESPGCLLNGLGVLFNEHSLVHYTCKIFISRIAFHQILLKESETQVDKDSQLVYHNL